MLSSCRALSLTLRGDTKETQTDLGKHVRRQLRFEQGTPEYHSKALNFSQFFFYKNVN
jgi:hypothetical protein